MPTCYQRQRDTLRERNTSALNPLIKLGLLELLCREGKQHTLLRKRPLQQEVRNRNED